MLDYPDEDCIKHGEAWFQSHRDHVLKLLAGAHGSIKPGGSDGAKPELWKDCHWKWFFERSRQMVETERAVQTGKLSLAWRLASWLKVG